MRSLFTDDIPGAVPRNRYYNKQLYLKKHLIEVERFGPKNPEYKRVFQWYVPPQKHIEPLQRNIQVIKPHNKRGLETGLSENLSQSLILNKNNNYEVTGKVTQGISLKNSSIFTSAAKNSLSQSFREDVNKNPYFPHQFFHRFNEENTSRMSGKRQWNDQIIQKIQVPAAKGQYFPKWT